ncbi:MAG TPA: tetratricopeptide repeat protein [Verrucomicrobiae bacterium]|nr:tetratricopeptide repeat protein [Verrucomicrobiae bacterium]
MSYGKTLLFLAAAVVVLMPLHSPAPLIYTPGEGWYYELPGQTLNWQRPRAKDQLEVAEQFFREHDYSNALRAAYRVVQMWPLSDYAPDAEYLMARALEAKHKDEAAFKAYQAIIEKYPNSPRYEQVIWEQYMIANRFLGGEWTKLWNVVPFFPSMDTAANMFDNIVTNGPYSDVAPHAQLRIGAAREKQGDYVSAVAAYGTAADRYHNQPVIAADAVFRMGESYRKQAATAEYDQGTAEKAIETFTDFTNLFADDKRVPEAQKDVVALKAEQVHGAFQVAQFYEKSHKWDGAAIYYNEVLQLDPNSPLAETARRRIEVLKPRLHVQEN